MISCVHGAAVVTVRGSGLWNGRFLLAAHEYIEKRHGEELAAEDTKRLRSGVISGVELVHGTARLAQMNLLLRGIGEPGGRALIDVRDALARAPRVGERASLVLANPPFGRKSGFSSVDEFGQVTRKDASYCRQICSALHLSTRLK